MKSAIEASGVPSKTVKYKSTKFAKKIGIRFEVPKKNQIMQSVWSPCIHGNEVTKKKRRTKLDPLKWKTRQFGVWVFFSSSQLKFSSNTKFTKPQSQTKRSEVPWLS